MKYPRHIFSFIAILVSTQLHAQETSHKIKPASKPFPAFAKNKFIATIAIGIPNSEMHFFPLPEKIESGGLSGNSPAYAKVEYGLTDNIGLVVNLLFDQYLAQYQTEQNNGKFVISTQHYSWQITLYSGGPSLNYHFKKFIHSYHFDPYIQAGFWTGLEYHFNQDDSYASFSKILVKPRVSAGIRYYVDKNIGLNLEAGYDWASIVNVGFSYRFLNAH